MSSTQRTVSTDSLNGDTSLQAAAWLRDLSHLRPWLDAFELLRARGVVLLDAFSQRITRELGAGGAVHDTPVITAPGEPSAQPAAALLRRCVALLRVLGKASAQYRLLRAEYRSAACAPSTAIVAISSKRLPLPPEQPPRERLVTLTRAMPGAPDRDRLGRAIADSDVILLFEPFRTALWEQPERFWRQRVYLVDYVFVALVLFLSPVLTARALVRERAALRAEWRGGLERFKGALAALLFTVAYQRLLVDAPAPRAFFFTSNSFASEVLRATLLRMPHCGKICELLHGIPTEEFEEYLETVLRFADDEHKHTFVQQLPGFPSYGVVAASVGGENNFAINSAVNRYFSDRAPQLRDLGGWIETEWRKLQVVGEARPPVFTLIGAAGTERDYLTSRAFHVELAMLQRAVTILRTGDRPFVICYAPHPAHPVTMFNALPFFREQRIAICTDTVLMWLLSDACTGLYSSALFEAAYVGVRVFTPLHSEDRLYMPGVLERLCHPRNGESWVVALDAFLESVRGLPAEPSLVRAERRLGLLVDGVGGGRREAVGP